MKCAICVLGEQHIGKKNVLRSNCFSGFTVRKTGKQII